MKKVQKQKNLLQICADFETKCVGSCYDSNK